MLSKSALQISMEIVSLEKYTVLFTMMPLRSLQFIYVRLKRQWFYGWLVLSFLETGVTLTSLQKTRKILFSSETLKMVATNRHASFSISFKTFCKKLFGASEFV